MTEASPEESRRDWDPIEEPSAWIRPLSPQRLSRGVVEQFREMLAMGRLVPGQRLPNERELAEMFGVSRNSIREALRQLEMLTIVESRRGDGTYVRELDVERLMAPFGAVIATSAAATDDVLEFRRTFEPDVAALAARKVDDEGRELLENALRAFEDAVDSGGAEAADVDFHFAIAQMTRNSVVIGVQRALMEVMAHFRTHLDPSSYLGGEAATEGHRAIVAAICAGDPDAARQAASEHVDVVARVLLAETPIEPRPLR
jgi:GntR family transcriptional regulator, transcriptional repressor for pyruvate dehydrogenase complex